ncbi:MAG: hypothetical protein AAF441_04355 [Pseudomonadota bacterium]
MLPEFVYITPISASLLMVVAVVAGYQYRQNWRLQGPAWKAWTFGTIAGMALLLLSFAPLKF